MAYDARAIANWVLDHADFLHLPITNLALNKILYFSHGWYLATENRCLVNYQFEAWEHGPVLPTVYHQFKAYRDSPIATRAQMIDLQTGEDKAATCSLSESDSAFMERMVGFYAIKSGPMLSLMSHEPGAPWAQVRGTHARPGMVISDDVIRAYFTAKLTRRRQRSDAH
jgi:uncharacterized phage-associated protein